MIKVDVISGFLGAGKTTLIKKLLKAYENDKVVLIENEFGEIGIDGDLVERDGFEVFEISSGCICCIMKKDFVKVFERIIKDFQPERIIIEPTGISILSEIIEVLQKPEFKAQCSINTLITIVDSVHYLSQREVFGEFFEDQITNASALMLSKSQFVNAETIDEITASLRALNADAPLVTANWELLSHEDIKGLLSGVELVLDSKSLFRTEYKPCSDNQFDTFAIETSVKFTRKEVEAVLTRLSDPLYGHVLRGKGFLVGTDYYYDFSYTNGSYMINQSNIKSSGKLCLIGRSLRETELKQLFKVKAGGIFKWLKF